MSSHHKLNPPGYEFHPEFGYLWPSQQLRQNVRVGLAAAAFGIITGALGAMALFPTHGGDRARAERAPAPREVVRDSATLTAPAPSIALPGTPSGTVAPSGTVEPAVTTSGVAEQAADKPCEEETWPYFDSKCLWGPARKDAKEVPAQTPAASAVTADRGAATNRSEQRRAAVSKKKTRTVKSSQRRRGREPDPRAAFASSPFGFQASPFGGRAADRARYGRPRDSGSGWAW